MEKRKSIVQLISYLIWLWRANGQLNELWASKDYQGVISFCNLMLRKNPADYLAFYYRGLSYEELGLFDEAIVDFKTSEISLNSWRARVLLKEYFIRIPIQLSRIYRKLQDNEKALEYADKAVQANEKDTDGLKWRASLKEDFGDYIGASEDLNEAMKRKRFDKKLVKMRDRLTYIIIHEQRDSQPLTPCKPNNAQS